MTLTFLREPRGPAFRELLGVLVGRATTVGLLISRGDTSAQGQRLFEALAGKALGSSETRSWPGSEIPKWASPRRQHIFHFDDEAADVLFAHCPDLSGWQYRALPDDLHLVAADGSVVLGSITSEDDAWVELPRDSWTALVAGTAHLEDWPMRED